jgi:hypothetical protein
VDGEAGGDTMSDPAFDVCLNTQELTQTLKQVEVEVERREICEAVKRGDWTLQIQRLKHTRIYEHRKYVDWYWRISVMAGGHCLIHNDAGTVERARLFIDNIKPLMTALEEYGLSFLEEVEHR